MSMIIVRMNSWIGSYFYFISFGWISSSCQYLLMEVINCTSQTSIKIDYYHL